MQRTQSYYVVLLYFVPLVTCAASGVLSMYPTMKGSVPVLCWSKKHSAHSRRVHDDMGSVLARPASERLTAQT